MKLVLFVEGETERKALSSFMRRWLDTRVSPRIGIQVVKFEGWPELVRDTPRKARMYLSKEDVIAVIALLDLYGPTFYPDGKVNALDRYEWAKRDLEMKVGDGRFRQFFAVHETEAWLLSDPSIFPIEVRRALTNVAPPEEVDFDEPPSKLSYWRDCTGTRPDATTRKWSTARSCSTSWMWAKPTPNAPG